jgi:hypothetical protein
MKNTQINKNILKIIVISIIFSSTIFLNNINSVDATWDCRNNSTYENKSEYDYLRRFGRQDKAECIRNSGCSNPVNWSDECSVDCTNPTGCGNCEARCFVDQLYYADIWRGDDRMVRSATCRHDTTANKRTSVCFPEPSIDSPASNASFTQGDEVVFRGSGTDMSDNSNFHDTNDEITGYKWVIRTVANNSASNYSQDIVVNQQDFDKSNLAVEEYYVYLQVTDETGAVSNWVRKRLSITEEITPINGACATNSPYTYESNVTSWPSTLNLYFCKTGTATFIASQSNFPGQGETVTWGCNGNSTGTSTSLTACSASRKLPPRIDGDCKLQSVPVTQLKTRPTQDNGVLCETGTATTILGDGSPENPWTWDCNGSGPNHTNDTGCKVQVLVDCASPDGEKNINKKPVVTSTNPLCLGEVKSPVVSFVEGRWEWDCTHNTLAALTTSCSADSCLAGDVLNVQAHVYLKDNPKEQLAKVSLNCPGGDTVCCKFTSTNMFVDNKLAEEICTGNNGKIEISTAGKYSAECYFKDKLNEAVEKESNVSTMCTQRECNSQGACQATPKTASKLSDCSSTCNSNADCSSGRIIETRP